jgi:hypothetical protein
MSFIKLLQRYSIVLTESVSHNHLYQHWGDRTRTVRGASPQSTILAQSFNTFSPAECQSMLASQWLPISIKGVYYVVHYWFTTKSMAKPHQLLSATRRSKFRWNTRSAFERYPTDITRRTMWSNVLLVQYHICVRQQHSSTLVQRKRDGDIRGNVTTALNLPVYMLQPKSGCMRLEPCRIPFGPKRAPGLAVTPYRSSAICCRNPLHSDDRNCFQVVLNSRYRKARQRLRCRMVPRLGLREPDNVRRADLRMSSALRTCSW